MIDRSTLRPCGYPPTPIEHTVDAQGFVLVDGHRVPHTAAGDHLRWTPSCTTNCAKCHRHNVPQTMHVVAQLDDVVPGGVQYFTAIKYMRPLCDECGDALASQKHGYPSIEQDDAEFIESWGFDPNAIDALAHPTEDP